MRLPLGGLNMARTRGLLVQYLLGVPRTCSTIQTTSHIRARVMHLWHICPIGVRVRHMEVVDGGYRVRYLRTGDHWGLAVPVDLLYCKLHVPRVL